MAVLTLAALKRHLGSKASDDEADLTALIDAAQSAVAARCGPLEPTSVTTRIAGCGATQIALPRRGQRKDGAIPADQDRIAVALQFDLVSR